MSSEARQGLFMIVMTAVFVVNTVQEVRQFTLVSDGCMNMGMLREWMETDDFADYCAEVNPDYTSGSDLTKDGNRFKFYLMDCAAGAFRARKQISISVVHRKLIPRWTKHFLIEEGRSSNDR